MAASANNPHCTPCSEQPRLARMEKTVIALEAKIDRLHDAVIGSENEAGAFERIREIEREHRIIWSKLDEVTKCITGNGTAGLNERVRILEQVRRKQEAFSWLLLSGVVVQGLIIARTLILGG